MYTYTYISIYIRLSSFCYRILIIFYTYFKNIHVKKNMSCKCHVCFKVTYVELENILSDAICGGSVYKFHSPETSYKKTVYFDSHFKYKVNFEKILYTYTF